jgi:hypothetical protein
MRRQGLLVGLLLAGTAMSTLAASPTVAQTTAARDPAFVDLKVYNDEIEAWRNAQYEAARRQGKATRAEFHRIDTEALQRARAAEIHRTRALEALSKTAKVPLGQGPGGTQPLEGRGTLGDIDTASLSGKDFNEVQKAAKKAGYTVVQQGDAFTIKELDVTVHRAPAAKAPSQVGSSGRAAEIGRGYNPETAMGLGANDPALSVADNLKKAAHTVNTPSDQISSADLQKLGKMTGRNADAVATVTGQPIDPVTRAQADMLKQNYSPEASGIVRDNATPAQRAEDIAAFQKKAKQVSVDAARAADVSANKAMEKLAAEARHANDVLDAVRQTGDADRIARAKANVENANRAVIEYAETRAAAQKSAVLNDADAAKIVNEARGIPNEGKPPSQIREAAVAGDRKALTAVAAEPTKPPGLSEGAAGQATGSLKSTLLKGAGLGATILQVVQGVARGAEEAGKEADEKGDGIIGSTVRTAAYSAWYGLGIGGAIETGKHAGEQSAEQWAKDVREGRVDPNSRLSQWYAKVRGVGWGIAEFTGLQAIKDATVESAGYVADRYGQYKNEKIEAAAKAAAQPVTPGAGTPQQAAGLASDPTKPGEDGSKPAVEAAKPAAPAVAGGGPAAVVPNDQSKAAARRPTPPVGQGIAGAGRQQVAAIPPKPVPQQTQPQSQPIAAPPPPPEPTTFEVAGGWLESPNGRTRLVYINDAKGNRIGGYYVHYDRTGKEIGRERFTEGASASNEPAPQAGAYSGRISGQAGGSIQLTVAGNVVSGRISGTYKGDGFTSNFRAALNPDGSFSAPARGVLNGHVFSKIIPYDFNGTVSGRVDGKSGAGRWSGKNRYGGASGAWQASR